NQNGDAERDGKFTEEASHDVAHEKERNQDRHERNGEGHDGEADLLGAFESGGEGLFALFDEADDVFDHDNGVIDDETGGNGEGHEREIVEAEAGQVHDGAGANERERDGEGGNDGGSQGSEKEKNDRHDQQNGDEQLDFHIVDRRANRGGEVGENVDSDAGRQGGAELGQALLDAVNNLNNVGAGLALDVEDDRRGLVHPCRLFGVLGAVDDGGDVFKHDRRALAIGDDDAFVIRAGGELVVGADLVAKLRAVKIAFGLVDAGLLEGGAQIFEVQAVGREGSGIGLDAHGRLLSAHNGDEAHAADLRNLLREPGVGQILDLGKWNRVGGQRHGHDRRVGRIGFAVNGRGRQVGRQISLRGIDGGLHLLLGDVDVQVKGELQRDDGAAAGADGRHLVEPRHLAELALERRSDGGGHDIGAGARIKRDDLDGGEIDFRQGRDGQLQVSDNADQENRGHQQRGGHRAHDKWARRIHSGWAEMFMAKTSARPQGWSSSFWAPRLAGPLVILPPCPKPWARRPLPPPCAPPAPRSRTFTLVPSPSLLKLSVAMVSPGSMPSTAVTFWSLTPTVMSRIVTNELVI